MIDIKCEYCGKVYRGQDFYRRYCSVCPNIKQVETDGLTMTCPYLRYYQSYKPKRKKPWEQGKPGKQARIPIGGY